MLSFLAELTIVKKIRVIISFVSFLVIFNIVGMYEISQTGHFQFLEREHIELAMLLEKQFSNLQNSDQNQEREILSRESSDRYQMGITPLLREIREPPQRCLDDVIGAEVLAFRILGFGHAFDYCRKDLQDNQRATDLISQYNSGQLDKQQLLPRLKVQIDNIFQNSHDFAVVIPEARVFVRNLMLTVNIILSVLAIVTITIISTSITRPLILLRSFIDQVKSSKDLSQQHNISSQDETADIASVLNYMLTEFEEILHNAHNHNSVLVQAAKELQAQTDENNRHLAEQNRSTETAATAINEITASINDVSRNTSDATRAASETHQGVMNANHSIGTATGAIEQLVEGMKGTEKVMAHLDSSSREIGEILSVIKEIADQTNLLALNASIESARAGEHGRGFAVVADEVRQLASRTRQSTDDIHKMIDIIQQASLDAIRTVQKNSELSSHTMSCIQEAGGQLEIASRDVESINSLSIQIAAAVEQQSQVMSEMNGNIHTIADLAESTNQGSANIDRISRQVVAQIDDMHSALASFRISH